MKDNTTKQNNNPTIGKRKIRPEWIVAKSFAIAILLGTVLLTLPVSSREGNWTNLIDALFTATSATCVTGLIVVDTGSYFSTFGQGVILALIQFGGLGIMTMGTFLLVAVGRRLSLNHEKVILDSFGKKPASGIKSILLLAVSLTLVLELLGAVILTWRFKENGFDSARSIWLGVFHAVSAYCNAGFSLFDDSLMGVREDHIMLLSFAILIILGGLGFLVLHNLACLRPWFRDRIRRGRLSLHSKIVLTASLMLLVAGWLLFFLLEFNGTMAELTWPDKFIVSFFQSVTPRTAGFNAVDMSKVSPPGLFLTIVLMFIGGGSGSTAGGIKVGTAVILWLTLTAIVKGREETLIGKRSISTRIVREAVSIFVVSMACVSLFFGILLAVEQGNLLAHSEAGTFDLLFELVSAFGTVGLSTGVTGDLTIAGKLLITITMFIGRLGPLTLALLVGRRQLKQAIKYPEEEVFVG